MSRGEYIGPRGERLIVETGSDNRPFSGRGGFSKYLNHKARAAKQKKERKEKKAARGS